MSGTIDDKAQAPDDAAVRDLLQDDYPIWTGLIHSIKQLEAKVTEEWTYSGKKYGWSLRLSHKKRPILRMKPQVGYISVGVLYGAKAYAAALSAELPEETLAALCEATAYPEGRGIRLEIRSGDQVALVSKLAKIKLDN